MSMKMKLISCISAFILVLGIMFGAVFSAEQVTLNIGGSVSFEALDVQATISQGIVTNGILADSANKMHEITLNATNDGTAELATWTDLSLTFNESGEDMTLSFTITNTHAERDLLVKLPPENIQGQYDNMEVVITANGETPDSVTIPASATAEKEYVEYVITFKVLDKNLSASIQDFSFNFVLSLAGKTYTLTTELPIGTALQVVEADRTLEQVLWENFYGITEMKVTISDVRELVIQILSRSGSTNISINGEDTITVTNDTNIELILTSDTNIEFII